MSSYSAVIDIGKTNKKVLVLNDKLETVASAYENFPADESGSIHFEQFEAARDWILDQLKKFAADYSIDAISITTHGATVVFIDEDGNFTVPPIAYTSSVPQEIYDKFYAQFGSKRELHEKLATPFLGSLLNHGMCVFFAKESFPMEFEMTAHILNLPSYFVHALTGVAGAEPTSIGCHSYFWDFEKKTWSFVAEQMGVLDKLPREIHQSHEVAGTITPAIAERTGLPADCKVTYGIHDSNSSLVPYLAHSKGRFLLNSTGTWCVCMCPNEAMSFTEAQMDAGAFYNVSALGQPVKTAIFMGGNEHDTWATVLREFAGLQDFPDFDEAVYQQVITDKNCFILPGVIDTGPFAASTSRVHQHSNDYLLSDIAENRPPCFDDPEYAYAALNLSLAIQSRANFLNVGLEDDMTVYIEGGFRKNTAYHALLAALCPSNNVVLSSLEEATAFGAALMNVAALEGKSLDNISDKFSIETSEVSAPAFSGLEDYAAALIKLAQA